MKKGFILTRFPLKNGWGGEEKLHLMLSKELKNNGINTVVLSSDIQLMNGFKNSNINCYRFFFIKDLTSKLMIFLSPFIFFSLLLQSLFFLFYLRIKGFRSVLMLTFVEKIFITPFALVIGYKIVWAHHAKISSWFYKNPFLFLWKYFARFVDIVVPSKDMKEDLLLLGKNLNIKIVHNAVDFSSKFVCAPKTENKKLKIGYAGRLSKEKNLTQMLSLAEKFPCLDFLIVGQGDEEKKLKNIIKKRKIKNVKFLGFLSNLELNKFYNSIDVFCLFSEYESFGLVLLEASFYSLPILAPKIGGIKDIFLDGKNAILFNNDDEVYDKFKIIINNKKLRTMLSHNAKENLSNFSKDIYIKKMEHILF